MWTVVVVDPENIATRRARDAGELETSCFFCSTPQSCERVGPRPEQQYRYKESLI